MPSFNGVVGGVVDSSVSHGNRITRRGRPIVIQRRWWSWLSAGVRAAYQTADVAGGALLPGTLFFLFAASSAARVGGGAACSSSSAGTARRAGSPARERRVDECRPASARAASSASAASGFHTSPTSRDWGSTSHRRNTPAATADQSTAARREAPLHVNVRTTIAKPYCLRVIMTASLRITRICHRDHQSSPLPSGEAASYRAVRVCSTAAAQSLTRSIPRDLSQRERCYFSALNLERS